MRYILWLQWDRFYIGEEQAGEPPRVVLREGRILDANSAAREKGIVIGEGTNLTRDCVLEQWKPEDYEARQREWLDICAEFTGIVEPIDQHIAALDLTDHPAKVEIVDRLVRRLVKRVGRPLLYGAASTKWIARLAALHADNGLALRDPATFLSNLRVIEMSPVDLAIRERLPFLGYHTIGSAAKIPLTTLQDQFGNRGLVIAQAAQGGVYHPVEALYPPGVLRECFLFESPIEDEETLRAGLLRLARRLEGRLADRQAHEMTLELEREDGMVQTVSRRLAKPVHNALSAVAAMREPLVSLLPVAVEGVEESPRLGYTALRITLADLRPIRRNQAALISTDQRPTVDSALRTVRSAFGEQAVRLGRDIEVPRRRRVLSLWSQAVGWY